MKDHNNQISATEFKKHFLNLIENVKNNNSSFIITKRNIPVAKVIPIETNKSLSNKNYFGSMKGNIKINSDIINNSFAEE